MATLMLPLPVARALARCTLGVAFNTRFSIAQQRAIVSGLARIVPLPAGIDVETVNLGGRTAELLTVGTPTPGYAVVLVHGGGFTNGSLDTHRSLGGLIARDTATAVYLPDYRLAPEAPYPAAVDDSVAAFLDLVENHGFAPEKIAIVGDSAASGITVAAARRLIDRWRMRPAALALLSPWVDPEAAFPATRDGVLNAPWLHACAAAYRGSASADDPGYAPLRGDLSGLPPTLIQIGTTELFHPQSVRLAAKIEAVGGEVTLQEFPALWHTAQLNAAQNAEAAEAVRLVTDFLSSRLHPVVVEPGPDDVA